MKPASGTRIRWIGAALALKVLGVLSACGTSTEPSDQVQGAPFIATSLRVAGPWFTDEQGRVVVLHGTNMINKLPPFAPDSLGFGDKDLSFLAANGFNAIRLGFIWAGVEPSPGIYDDTYIDRVVSTAILAEKYGLLPMLDFHQDGYSMQTGGDGAPDWAVITDGAPKLPIPGSAGGLVNGLIPFENFWDDAKAPDGIGLQEHYAAAWRHIALRLSGTPHLVYEIFNEPYAGIVDNAACADPVGCPEFEVGKLAPFYEKVLAALRPADPDRMILVEPQFTFGIGVRSWLPRFSDTNIAFAFHDYCVEEVVGLPATAGCDALDSVPLANAEDHFGSTGEPNIMNEFGAGAPPNEMAALMAQADARMLSWVQWAYWAQDAQQPQTYGIVADINKGPYGTNVKQDLLAILNEPFPRLVSGTPRAWQWDAGTATFSAAYTTTRADGSGSFPLGSVSEFFVNPRYYPSGYRVEVEGGSVVSDPQSSYLRVAAQAPYVKLSVRPK